MAFMVHLVPLATMIYTLSLHDALPISYGFHPPRIAQTLSDEVLACFWAPPPYSVFLSGMAGRLLTFEISEMGKAQVLTPGTRQGRILFGPGKTKSWTRSAAAPIVIGQI